MSAFRVLFVCIGNVCRSPLGERLLASRLQSGEYEISSAGVQALVGARMSQESAALLESYGGSAAGFRARQLEPEMVDASDLVLTATKELRARVLTDSPSALRRTFTVLEFADLLDEVPGGGDLGELVAEAAASRSMAKLTDYDIPDPFRRGREVHERAAELMEGAVGRIAKGLDR